MTDTHAAPEIEPTRGADVVGPLAVGELAAGSVLPDFELLDHARNTRRLSQLVAGDPTVL